MAVPLCYEDLIHQDNGFKTQIHINLTSFLYNRAICFVTPQP